MYFARKSQFSERAKQMKHKAKIVVMLTVIIGCICGFTMAAVPNLGEEQLGWGIGATCWTFRSFTFCEAVDKADQLGLRYLEGLYGQKLSKDFPGKMDVNMSDDQIARVKKKLDSAGVRLASMWYGKLPGGQAQCRKIFEWLRKLNVKTVSSEPALESLDTIEKLCKEYGIKVGLHNHPKPNSIYWNCDTVVNAIKGREYVGDCADTGHWLLSGVNPIQALKKLQGKVFVFHFKDRKKTDGKSQIVRWGTGDLNAKAVLEEMARQKAKVVFYIEYEPKWHSGSMNDLAKNVKFFRDAVKDIIARGIYDNSEVNSAFERVKTYGYGQQRKPILAIESLIHKSYTNAIARKELELRLGSLLSAKVSRATKEFAFRQLSMIGSYDTVPALAKLLTDEDLSHLACFALELIPSASADKALRDALGKTKGKTKVGIINALASRGNSKSVHVICGLLNNPDKEVSKAAAAMLGKLGGAEAADTLGKALPKASQDVYTDLADAYLKCADKFAASGDKQSAVAIYKQMYVPAECEAIRIAALRGMVAVMKK